MTNPAAPTIPVYAYAGLGMQRRDVMAFASEVLTAPVIEAMPEIVERIDRAAERFLDKKRTLSGLPGTNDLCLVSLAARGLLAEHLCRAIIDQKRVSRKGNLLQTSLKSLTLRNLASLRFTDDKKIELTAALIVARFFSERVMPSATSRAAATIGARPDVDMPQSYRQFTS